MSELITESVTVVDYGEWIVRHMYHFADDTRRHTNFYDCVSRDDANRLADNLRSMSDDEKKSFLSLMRLRCAAIDPCTHPRVVVAWSSGGISFRLSRSATDVGVGWSVR